MGIPFGVLVLVFCSEFIIAKTELNDSPCGKPSGSFIPRQDRIVAGYDVGYYRYPWYAALVRNNQVSCGAALIGPSTVLTAAHCYKEFLDLASKGVLKLEDIYQVRLGVYNICNTEPTQKNYKIQRVQIHESYYNKKPYYDLCLITLEGDTKAYTPICLPEFEMKTRPKDGTVPGLGTLKYKGAMPCTVHEARLLIYNDTQCRDMINRTGNDVKAMRNAFCAGYIQGGVDTCQGDSGGPLQIVNKNGAYVLLGVVSFGFRCAMPGLLGMYTDISQYLDWIQEKSGLDSGIVNLIYSKTSSWKPTRPHRPSHTKGHHMWRPHFGRPNRRPIKIILS